MPVPELLIHGTPRPVTSTWVMGVVNASPESFSDAGRYRTRTQQLGLAADLAAGGADVLDIGGQSAITRRPEIDPDVEIERVVPIVTWLAGHHPDVLISVDTYKPAVARAALQAGASIVNDVSGLLNPELATMCADAGAALVIMHTRARPKVRMQDPGAYVDVVADVVDFLDERIDIALDRGLPRESIILDAGPDFAKTPHQTIAVLRELDQVRAFGRPVLLALSRKDFLGAILNVSPAGREVATHAALAHYIATPGNIARVHDVAAAVQIVRTMDVLTGRAEIAADYLLADRLRHEPSAAGVARRADE